MLTVAAKDWVTEAESILRESKVHVLRDVVLRSPTSLGVGGPARLFLVPARAEDLADVLEHFASADVPFDYLGAGSNLLVADAGPSFVVISSEGLDTAPEIARETVRVGAGYSVPKLAKRVATAGLSGIEFAEGIPGSVGGCVRMNAGWHEGMFGDSVSSFLAVSRRGEIEDLFTGPETFAYRQSPGIGDRFIAAATLTLTPDDPVRIKERMKEFHDKRVATQPTAAKNAGCIFRNPPDNHAGKLIDSCGLKGTAIGAAVVSEVHANFIVNRGGATHKDVATLIDKVRDEVNRKTGITLETEVVVWS
ncbi:MAG TPA: UDP-N-acetylmuramate dehydrogenase [Patescibacteria group bacterium]|nr:UDP-N-acetylmuramate dehydrogenase [Patescibacteria group bacterium]